MSNENALAKKSASYYDAQLGLLGIDRAIEMFCCLQTLRFKDLGPGKQSDPRLN